MNNNAIREVREYKERGRWGDSLGGGPVPDENQKFRFFFGDTYEKVEKKERKRLVAIKKVLIKESSDLFLKVAR